MDANTVAAQFGIEEFNLSSKTSCACVEQDLPDPAAMDSDIAEINPLVPFASDFDYSGLSIAVATEAEEAAQRIRNLIRGSVIDTGCELLAIKVKLGHGKFGPWLAHHFTMSERTAQNCMNAAEVFGAAPRVVDILPPSTVYKLAAKSTPEEVRQCVIDEVAAGGAPDAATVEARITSAKSAERRRREEERAAKQEEIDWQKHEQALRNVGRPDDEIESERKRWDTNKAQEERRQDKKLAEDKKREDQEHRASEEQQRREAKMKHLAVRAAEILKQRLGADFEKVRNAVLALDHSELRKAMFSV